MTMTQFSQVVRQLWQYGPFAFAVVYLVLIRWAYKTYTNACKRRDPPASDREKNTCRLYFLGTAMFGGTLVVVSVIWWLVCQPFPHVFEGVIENLCDYDKVASEYVYFSRRLHERYSPDDPESYDAHFAVIQDKPFTPNEPFSILYWTRGMDWENREEKRTTREILDLYYCTEAKPRFYIDFDEESEKHILCQKKTSATQKHSSLFVSLAHAQPQVEPSLELPILHATINPTIIRILQNERTDIPTKIATLDELNTLSHEELKEYVEASTSKEPVILTLLDLSRHTDKELAYKARKIIERFDWHSIVVNRLLSDDIEIQEEAEAILSRIENDRAEAILRRASSQMETAQLNELRQEIRFGQRTRVLIPTGSWQGDRYYVKVEWDATQETVVTCLTELFNKELRTDRTPEEEERLMEGRTERYLYWYSKEWALGIAEKVEQCGARANYVAFPTSTSR